MVKAGKASSPTFAEQKLRGDRAMLEATMAIRGLRIAVRESEALRDLVDAIHHGRNRKPLEIL